MDHPGKEIAGWLYIIICIAIAIYNYWHIVSYVDT